MDLALAIIFMCFGAISLVAFLLQKVKKYTLIETFTKTITSMFMSLTVRLNMVSFQS